MTANAKKTFGTQFYLVPDGGSLVLLAGLTNIGKPGLDHGFEDSTSHDSPDGAAQKIPHGVYEVQAFQVEGEYIAKSALDDALLLATKTGALQDAEIHEHGATGYVKTPLTGYVTNYLPAAAPVRGKQTHTFTFTPTGALGARATVS